MRFLAKDPMGQACARSTGGHKPWMGLPSARRPLNVMQWSDQTGMRAIPSGLNCDRPVLHR